jgi:hypothetical protein
MVTSDAPTHREGDDHRSELGSDSGSGGPDEPLATAARTRPTEAGAQTTAGREETGSTRVFRYQLVDIAGRYVDAIERRAPLRADEEIILHESEAWRIVAVLGTSATVARGRRGARA